MSSTGSLSGGTTQTTRVSVIKLNIYMSTCHFKCDTFYAPAEKVPQGNPSIWSVCHLWCEISSGFTKAKCRMVERMHLFTVLFTDSRLRGSLECLSSWPVVLADKTGLADKMHAAELVSENKKRGLTLLELVLSVQTIPAWWPGYCGTRTIRRNKCTIQ